jgi:DNA-binding CsgD family transcriptional regulator
MRIYIVSPYPTVRAGLVALAREQPGWVVVGASAPNALSQLERPGASPATGVAPLPPTGAPGSEAIDVALIDLEGALDAEALDGWLAALRPRAGVVILGAADAAAGRGALNGGALRQLGELARVVEANGQALGALLRDADADEIVTAVNAVAGGLITLDRRLGRAFFQPERIGAPTTATLGTDEETLTAREREVLQLLAQGFPNKIIALRLHISEHTAKFHVSAIMTKLGAASRTEAVTNAARRGLLIL